MSYPTPGEYQEAVQFPETAFADEELQEADPETTVLGLPRVITGAFAAVFPLSARKRRWAVKCFIHEAPDRRKRYRAIGDFLEDASLPFTVGFEYQPSGIRVEEASFPLLKMEWVTGTPLNQFVEAHLEEPGVLQELQGRWRDLLVALEEASAAHGDLQHGNVLVVEGEGQLDLRLVDYDTMYVPSLSGWKSAEAGHRNYQHPDRTEDAFGPHLDRFAGLIIYTALQACIHRPELWKAYDTGENMLFRSDDFYDPDASPLFDELDQDGAMQLYSEAVRTACYLEPEAVPALSDLLADPSGTSLVDRLRHQARRMTRDRHAAARTVGARSPVARYLGPAVLLILLVTLVLGTAWSWIGALGMLTLGTLGAGWVAWYDYRRIPAVRRHRRLQQEVDYFERRIVDMERQVMTLKEQRADITSSVDRLREERLQEQQQEALHERLKYHFVGEAKAVDGVTHKHVVRLKAADIRTAYECTPERLAEVGGIGDRSRARIRMWRSGLVRAYEDEIPDTLSEAEERRLERYVERRAGDLTAEVDRVREKIRVHAEELERVRRRQEQVPRVRLNRYLRYVAYLGELPGRFAVSAPPRSAGTERAAVRQEEVAGGGPWWRQGST